MKTGEKMRIELKDENTEEITEEKEPETGSIFRDGKGCASYGQSGDSSFCGTG